MNICVIIWFWIPPNTLFFLLVINPDSFDFNTFPFDKTERIGCKAKRRGQVKALKHVMMEILSIETDSAPSIQMHTILILLKIYLLIFLKLTFIFVALSYFLILKEKSTWIIVLKYYNFNSFSLIYMEVMLWSVFTLFNGSLIFSLIYLAFLQVPIFY